MSPGISLQLRFFSELPHCPPTAKFVFAVTEAVHTFSSYNFSRAMTVSDLEDAYAKCLDSYSTFTDESGPDLASTPDILFAQ